MTPGLSLVIPAYNEEKCLPETLAFVREALARLERDRGVPTELIVVDNASTDRTAELAGAAGARVVPHEVRNIASVRNAGLCAARFGVAATVDADTFVPPEAFVRIWDTMATGKYVGGGVRLRLRSPKRLRRAITAIMELTAVRLTGISGGMFFFSREDALAIGGFPEEMLVAEDLTFATRLREHGRKRGRKFLNLRTVTIRTFDRKDISILGALGMFWLGIRAFAGVKFRKEELGYWYDPKR